MTIDPAVFTRVADRLDRIVNIDIGGRGVEHLFAAERERTGTPLIEAAARYLTGIRDGDTVVVTTGSVSRSWISPEIGENDGPAGAAAIVRAIVTARRATVIVLAEQTLLAPIGKMLVAAGVTVLPVEQAREASRGGTLLAATLMPFTVEDENARSTAAELLDLYTPSLLLSIERTGRNADGVYCSMRGVDYGDSRARIDHVFDLAAERGLPTIAIGDGGNEIGMANVADAIRAHIPFGDRAAAGGAGLGAVTGASALVTAACSNWGAYALVAAWAVLEADPRLVHTPTLERFLLQRGVEIGLINSVAGLVDDRVDNISAETHVAVAQFISSVVERHI